jgi:AraC-like DNA-binding protein
MSLIVILPDRPALIGETRLLTLVTEARPQSILPHHEAPTASELAQVLKKPPEDLPVDVTDYLAWRGIDTDRDTRHLLRKIVELSAELRSVSALSRGLYVSRRALGRRFLSQGLPVPSHWLQFSRLLRVSLRLQNTDESVLSLGFSAGYPDGFSLSNQMYRLTGHRPTDARRFLGWEWLMEAWLRREADTGGLAPPYSKRLPDALAPHPAAGPPVRRIEAPGHKSRPQARRRRIVG